MQEGERMTRLPVLLAAMILCCGHVLAQSIPASRTLSADRVSASLPHQTHDGITLSADPYDSLPRIKKNFKNGDLWRAGVVPVEVTFQNDSEYPVRIDLNTITLDAPGPGVEPERLRSLKATDVGYAIVNPTGPPNTEHPYDDTRATWDAKSEAIKIDRVILKKDLIPAKSSIHGFLFFRIGRDMRLIVKSSIDVPDVFLEPSEKALMFFEVPMGSVQHP
jgi:hypothetical protein